MIVALQVWRQFASGLAVTHCIRHERPFNSSCQAILSVKKTERVRYEVEVTFGIVPVLDAVANGQLIGRRSKVVLCSVAFSSVSDFVC